MKRLLAPLLLALAASLPAQAGQLLDVSVRDLDNGQVLPAYPHEGRWYVPGTPGNRYAVVLHNRLPERVLALLSVDGVNAVTGQTADFQQSGYVLEPYQRVEIRGWRKNLRESAEFYFTELPDSYAARTGRPFDVGVIGVAVFREQPVYRAPPPRLSIGQERRRVQPQERAAESAAAPQAGTRDALQEESMAKSHGLPAPRQELGTGHGEVRYDPARQTSFRRRSSQPDEIVSLFYDDYHALLAQGVIPRRGRYPEHRPNPFPLGFVPDPPRRW